MKLGRDVDEKLSEHRGLKSEVVALYIALDPNMVKLEVTTIYTGSTSTYN